MPMTCFCHVLGERFTTSTGVDEVAAVVRAPPLERCRAVTGHGRTGHQQQYGTCTEVGRLQKEGA